MPKKNQEKSAPAKPFGTEWDPHLPTISAEIAAKYTQVQDRIEYIADLMAAGKYRTRKTCRELRIVWQISESRMQQLRESAAAVMRASLGKSEEIRNKALMTLDLIADECVARGRKDEGDFSFKWFEIATKAAEGMGRFADREIDERIDAEKRRKEEDERNRAARDGPPVFRVHLSTPLEDKNSNS